MASAAILRRNDLRPNTLNVPPAFLVPAVKHALHLPPVIPDVFDGLIHLPPALPP